MITHLSIEVTHNQINATTSEDSYAIVDQAGNELLSTWHKEIAEERHHRQQVYPNIVISRVAHFPILVGNQVHSNLPLDNLQITSLSSEAYHCLEI